MNKKNILLLMITITLFSCSKKNNSDISNIDKKSLEQEVEKVVGISSEKLERQELGTDIIEKNIETKVVTKNTIPLELSRTEMDLEGVTSRILKSSKMDPKEWANYAEEAYEKINIFLKKQSYYCDDELQKVLVGTWILENVLGHTINTEGRMATNQENEQIDSFHISIQSFYENKMAYDFLSSHTYVKFSDDNKIYIGPSFEGQCIQQLVIYDESLYIYELVDNCWKLSNRHKNGRFSYKKYPLKDFINS